MKIQELVADGCHLDVLIPEGGEVLRPLVHRGSADSYFKAHPRLQGLINGTFFGEPQNGRPFVFGDVLTDLELAWGFQPSVHNRQSEARTGRPLFWNQCPQLANTPQRWSVIGGVDGTAQVRQGQSQSFGSFQGAAWVMGGGALLLHNGQVSNFGTEGPLGLESEQGGSFSDQLRSTVRSLILIDSSDRPFPAVCSTSCAPDALARALKTLGYKTAVMFDGGGATSIGVRKGNRTEYPHNLQHTGYANLSSCLGVLAPLQVTNSSLELDGFGDPRNFLAEIEADALRSQADFGIPAAVVMAQAGLETGWGRFIPTDKNSGTVSHNLFGVKWSGQGPFVLSDTKEFVNGAMVSVEAKFQAYSSYEGSFAGHAQFLSKPRYLTAKAVSHDPIEYARQIHRAGYATDPEYSNKLIAIMTQYDLLRHRPAPTGPQAIRIGDVPDDHWAAPAVRWTLTEGLMSLQPDGNFLPDAPLTRVQLAAILHRLSMSGMRSGSGRPQAGAGPAPESVSLNQPGAANPAPVSAGIVCLDAGHGGSDPGAVGPSGLREKDVALAVTLAVRDQLTRAGVRVVLTRDRDKDVASPTATAGEELGARTKIANEAKAQLFVSIHCNSFSSASAHGTETFHNPGSSKGKQLARAIQDRMIEFMGSNEDRDVKQSAFFVLRHTNMPAALAELAFISNPQQEKLLADPSMQKRFAEAIAKGILAQLAVAPPAPPAAVPSTVQPADPAEVDPEPAPAGWPNLSPNLEQSLRAALAHLLEAGLTRKIDSMQLGEAVKEFRVKAGLTNDAKLDEETWLKLIPELQRGSEGPAVIALQHLLRHRHGYSLGATGVNSDGVDGDFGGQTERALFEFRQAFNIPQGSTVDSKTWKALLERAPLVPSDRQALAKALLAEHQKGATHFEPVLPSRVQDGADAFSNIKDTAAGGKAKRSAYETAPGGTVDLSETMLKALLTLRKVHGFTFKVSCIAGGSHSSRSWHYEGTALDFIALNGQWVDESPHVAKFMRLCRELGAKEVLGPGDNGHSTHIHAAWTK